MIQLKHYRDHNHGGKFDGGCWVSSGIWHTAAADRLVPIRARFRWLNFGAATEMAVWGSGTTYRYALVVVKSGLGAYLRLYYPGGSLDCSDYLLYTDTIYDAECYYNNTYGYYEVRLYDRYRNPIRNWQSGAVSNTGVDATVFYIGALNPYIVPLIPFNGIIYDYGMYGKKVGGTDVAYQQLGFVEGFEGVSAGYIGDFRHEVDGVLNDAPADFWPVVTDLSNYTVSLTGVECSVGDLWEPDVSDTITAKIADASGISFARGDCLSIYDPTTYGLTHLYEIDSVGDVVRGVQELRAVNVLSRLEMLSPLNYVSDEYYSSGTIVFYNRTGWYSHNRPVNSGYATCQFYWDASVSRDRWCSLLHLLEQPVYLLQLESIITVNERSTGSPTSELYGNSCPLGIDYNMLAIHINSVHYADTDTGGATPVPGCTALDLWVMIQKFMRVRGVLSGGHLYHYPVEHVTTTPDADDVIATDSEIVGSRYPYRVNQTVQDPVDDIFDATFAGTDTDYTSTPTTSTDYVDIDMPSNVIIGKHGSADSTFHPFTGGTFLPALQSLNYIYAGVLNVELQGERKQCSYTIPLDNGPDYTLISVQHDYKQRRTSIVTEVR